MSPGLYSAGAIHMKETLFLPFALEWVIPEVFIESNASQTDGLSSFVVFSNVPKARRRRSRRWIFACTACRKKPLSSLLGSLDFRVTGNNYLKKLNLQLKNCFLSILLRGEPKGGSVGGSYSLFRQAIFSLHGDFGH